MTPSHPQGGIKTLVIVKARPAPRGFQELKTDARGRLTGDTREVREKQKEHWAWDTFEPEMANRGLNDSGHPTGYGLF